MNNIPLGYKKTEIGVIPEDWEVKTIKEAFDICNNLRLPISEDVRKTMQGDYPYYGPTKIQDYLNEYRVEGEYALIGEDGDHFLKWSDIPMTQLAIGKFNVNNHAHIVKGKSNSTLTQWFYYFFKNRDITQHLTRQGAGRYKLSKSTLLKIPCAIPSALSEQTAISKALSDTDTLINSLEKLIAKKRSIKQGAMQKLLKMKEGWEVKRLGEVADMYSGGTPLTSNSNYYNGNIPWVVIADITKAGKYISETEKTISIDGISNSSAKLFKKGILLFAMYASIGKTTIPLMDTTCNQAILGIKPKLIDTEYLYYFLSFNEKKFLTMGQTGAQSNLSKDLVQKIEILIPRSLETQIYIATILSDIDTEIAAIEVKLEKYRMVRMGMMQNLLTGKIRLV